jgi:phage shock protein E
MMRHPLVRLLLNFTVYLVFGGAILAFVTNEARSGRTFAEVVGAAIGVALWSGTLTTLIETRIIPLRDPARRSLLAALCGGLSLGGFAAILSVVAWKSPQAGFIAIGLVAGALMQGARAFSVGGRPRANDDDDTDADADADDDGEGQANGAKEMTPKQLIASGALALDVRSQSEFDAGHLATAKHLPLDQVAGRVDDVEAWAGGKDKPIVVYCAMGGRAGRARGALLAAGFTNVVNGGGYSSLK